MIYLEMYGRLGNQFFRYAAARALQELFYPDEELVINFHQINNAAATDLTYYNVLDDFNVAPYSIYGKGGKVIFNESDLRQKAVCIPFYLGMKKIKPEQMLEQVKYEKKWLKQLNSNGLYWFRRGSWDFQASKHNNKFLSGNFEDPKYFEKIRNILLREFAPKHQILDKNRELFNLIGDTNSICLSVRRGDFEINADLKKLQSICDRKYFENAIEAIKKKVNNPTFFMFSDDIGWVRENITTGCPTYYEDGTDPVWEKLRLMSACKHFIVSNSTFSWWVQYLSQNEEKIVVSPCRWFKNDYDSPLIDKKWIKIEV